MRYTRLPDEYTKGESFTDCMGPEVMPRRATAMMAVLAVIVHCVLGCCARCLNASDHHHYHEPCQANCICCEHHPHHDDIELCLQPAGSWHLEEASQQTNTQQGSPCPGCGKAKCAFIFKEPMSKRLTGAYMLPTDVSWANQAYQPPVLQPQELPPHFLRRTSAHKTLKVRLHLCLNVLTL